MSCDSNSTAAEQLSASQTSQNIADDHEGENLHTVIGVLSVMAQTRLLPVPAWTLCKLVHQTVIPVVRMHLDGPLVAQATHASVAQAFITKSVVRLQLVGPFEQDPLLALAATPAASTSSAETTKKVSSVFGDVTVMIVVRPGVIISQLPTSLQGLHLQQCHFSVVAALLHALICASQPGLQSDAPVPASLPPLRDAATSLLRRGRCPS
eukprot:TRINITY_DN8332_c1_g3_i1.p1 TRINITY_DN8332_c1_g3~~TRINITY_DN8332_c1_g3_i1.p1  ORF type:complete len:224 (-),score=28.75 TRINITY_DN8332_c1_g3_i1:272-898(-)